MAEIRNVEKVIAALRARAAQARKDDDVAVAVGYTAKYALWVHENMEIHPPGMKLAGQPRPSGLGEYWGPNGQPKFLTGPMHRIADELAAIVRKALQTGKTLAQALVLAGLRLQRESMRVVPVEYGNLRASAFTRLESKKDGE